MPPGSVSSWLLSRFLCVDVKHDEHCAKRIICNSERRGQQRSLQGCTSGRMK